MAGPLSHIRVLDLSRVLAGPWAGQILADLGAEVLKVERPKTGDDSRAFGPPWLKDASGKETKESAYFASANRGKKSVTVNFSKPGGQNIVRDFARQSDVLIENYKVGDLALLDSTVALLANQGASFLAIGNAPGRLGNAHPNIVPYQTFRTADGDVIVACGNDGQFRRFCGVADCAQLADDPRFATNSKRVQNRAELTKMLAGIVAKRPTRHWVEALEAAGVPSGPINTIDRVFGEPQALARGLRFELPHPTAGKVSLVRSPMRFSETPVEHELPPPTLGQHTDEILHSVLKLGDAEIARLHADGVI